MTEAAPTTQAEQEDAVRADLIAFFQDRYWQVPRLIVDEVDALLAGPLATLRARAAAAETERDEARQRADDLFWTITEPAKAARHWQMKATAAEAQRDQLAADLRKAREETEKLRGVLKTIAEGEVMIFDEGLGFDVSFWMDEEEMSALARAALTPDPKDAGGTAKGDDQP